MLFHHVIGLPLATTVLDLSHSIDERIIEGLGFAIGKYDEKREGTYKTLLFGGVRNVHMGIDLFSPIDTPVFAFADGEIHCFGYNPASGDYGHVIITRHQFDGVELYALYGHLSAKSLEGKQERQAFKAGAVLGFVGARHENGGWPPHLHFQLSYERPPTHDMPGVVAEADRAIARLKYPDPRLVLGPLY